ncbi:class II fumarate hydratase [Tomitella cavernea]|nr:class II fumarate hydratase [Tomitella cavernea]
MSDNAAGFRIEHDTMGEVQVPVDALWRAQTQRAVENFPISGRGLERAQIRALGLLKAACARVNKELGLLDAAQADAIVAAAEQIAAGRHDAQFPIDVFQTGSGTSSNMNTNEVIASLAAADGVTVHPNDHVNMSQSSNDTFPTAVHVAAAEMAVHTLVPALEHLEGALADKATEWWTVVKSGRTHLMDAVPITLGQEFSGYARQVQAGIERVRATLPRLGELPIGGTAVGTGLNAPDGFGIRVVEELRRTADLDVLSPAVNSFEAQAARDGLVEASGALRTVAVSLTKIANDVRWMGSGPLTGLAEIRLPDLQPGSSIMPGKVNPVLPEAVTQVAAQVVGNDAAVAWAGAGGAFELNVYIPVMARNVLESLRLLSNVSRLFADRCIAGLEADEERLQAQAESSPSIVTPLNSAIGYETAAKVAKKALADKTTIRQAAVDSGLVPDSITEDELDRRLDVLAMTRAESGETARGE